MSIPQTDQQFAKIIEEITQDQNVLAFWIDGSRGKGMETENSDYDGRMIVKDNVIEEYKQKYGSKQNPEIEISVMTQAELVEHAKYGTPMFWDRYNFVHLKVLFDRTGKIQEIIDQKAKLDKQEQKIIIQNAIGAFINQVYRLEKNLRNGNKLAAKFEAIEAIPFFIEAIFALEGRIRPYNKYLEWELDKNPLNKFPWEKDELIDILLSIVEKEQLHLLHELFITIKPIFIDAGFNEEFDEWKGYYKVG